jgi:hypothetical protein
MGLSVTVGILADLLENDPESAELVRGDFDIINEILRQHGLPDHEEPTSLPMLHDRSGVTGFPYSFLHYLRRFYARWIAQREQPFARRLYARWISKSAQVPPPVHEGEKPALDPVLDKIASSRHHLLWHSDCEGYYVPIDFPRVLEDKRIDGGGIGSSVSAGAENQPVRGALKTSHFEETRDSRLGSPEALRPQENHHGESAQNGLRTEHPHTPPAGLVSATNRS